MALRIKFIGLDWVALFLLIFASCPNHRGFNGINLLTWPKSLSLYSLLQAYKMILINICILYIIKKRQVLFHFKHLICSASSCIIVPILPFQKAALTVKTKESALGMVSYIFWELSFAKFTALWRQRPSLPIYCPRKWPYKLFLAIYVQRQHFFPHFWW